MTDKKEFYRNNLLPSTPLYHQPWWLDAVANNAWDVALVLHENKIIGSMPYFKNAEKIINPPFVQFLGPLISPELENKKLSNYLGDVKNILDDLFAQLPPHDFYNQRWSTKINFWLPLYWKGFQQTTRYTYLLNNISNNENVWNEMKDNIRGKIRKAEKILTVESNTDIKAFYEILSMTYQRQNLPNPHSYKQVETLMNAAFEKQAGKLFFAYDKERNLHAAIAIFWDKESAYNILNGSNPALRNSGAISLLLWESIKHCSTFVDKFDFEGSMMEPIEIFYRSFGAVPTPYFEISKTNSKVLKIKQGLGLIKSALFSK